MNLSVVTNLSLEALKHIGAVVDVWDTDENTPLRAKCVGSVTRGVAKFLTEAGVLCQCKSNFLAPSFSARLLFVEVVEFAHGLK